MEHIGPSRKRQCSLGLECEGPKCEREWKEYKRCFFSPPQKYTVVREEGERKKKQEGGRKGWQGKACGERERGGWI